MYIIGGRLGGEVGWGGEGGWVKVRGHEEAAARASAPCTSGKGVDGRERASSAHRA